MLAIFYHNLEQAALLIATVMQSCIRYKIYLTLTHLLLIEKSVCLLDVMIKHLLLKRRLNLTDF